MKKKYILLIALLGSISIIGAQTTIIPDSNFEQTLISKGLDDVLDGSVVTANISNITELNLNVIGPITDLTGIEDFTSLQILNADFHDLTVLDLSSNLMLIELSCKSNFLTSLDLSANTALTKLECQNQEISSLNISSNTALIDVFCFGNQLSELNVNGLINLQNLVISVNFLTTIDISTNIALVNFVATNNDFTCIQVNQTQLDGITSFDFNFAGFLVENRNVYSLDCSTLSVDDFVKNQYRLYPNPTSNLLFIKGKTTDISIIIYDALGREVISQKSTNQIDFNPLKRGIYFVKISDGFETSINKIIKD